MPISGRPQLPMSGRPQLHMDGNHKSDNGVIAVPVFVPWEESQRATVRRQAAVTATAGSSRDLLGRRNPEPSDPAERMQGRQPWEYP
jgi:hypothetical protein